MLGFFIPTLINGQYWAEVTYNGTTGWVAATSPEAAEELKALEASERDFVMSVTVMSSGMITGYTKHGLAQAIGRDGGKGVNPQAILDAVKNPQQIIHQAGETIKYIGENATVVLNKFGEIVTTWARNSFGTLQAVDLRTVRAVLEQVLDEPFSVSAVRATVGFRSISWRAKISRQCSRRLAVAPYLLGHGTAFFETVKEKGLEGIVGKKIDRQGRRHDEHCAGPVRQ